MSIGDYTVPAAVGGVGGLTAGSTIHDLMSKAKYKHFVAEMEKAMGYPMPDYLIEGITYRWEAVKKSTKCAALQEKHFQFSQKIPRFVGVGLAIGALAGIAYRYFNPKTPAQ